MFNPMASKPRPSLKRPLSPSSSSSATKAEGLMTCIWHYITNDWLQSQGQTKGQIRQVQARPETSKTSGREARGVLPTGKPWGLATGCCREFAHLPAVYKHLKRAHSISGTFTAAQMDGTKCRKVFANLDETLLSINTFEHLLRSIKPLFLELNQPY